MNSGVVPSIKCVLIGDHQVGKTSLINAFATREPLNQYFLGLRGPVQIHIEHLFHLYLLHIHDTDGTHPPATPPLESQADEREREYIDGKKQLEISPNEGNYEFDHDSDEEEDSDEIYDFGEDVGPYAIMGDTVTMKEEQRRWKSLSRSSRKLASGRSKWVARRVEYGLADIILICFSLADRASFEHVRLVWRKEIQQLCPHIPFMLVGLKLDLRRPDPTTPAALPSRKHRSHPNPQQIGPSSSGHLKQLLLYSRRPKPTRSSTTSTTAGEAPTTPNSPSTSSFGHQMRIPSTGTGKPSTSIGSASIRGESDLDFDPTTSRVSQREQQPQQKQKQENVPTSPNRSTFLTKSTAPSSFTNPLVAPKPPSESANDTTPIAVTPSPSPPEADGSIDRPKAKRASTFSLGSGIAKSLRRKSIGIGSVKPLLAPDNVGAPSTLEGSSPSRVDEHPPSAYIPPSTDLQDAPTRGLDTHSPPSTSSMTPQKKFIGHEPSPDPLQQQRRHPSLPPFMRSFSQHATVIRRVISRSRSRGTTMTESPVTDTDEKVLKVVGAGTGGTSGGGAGVGGENRVDSSKGKGKILRPALAHRITSGSADQEVSSVRNLESRVRTTSQPSPTRDATTSTHPDQGLGAKPPTSSNVGKVQGADASSRGLGVPGSSKGLGTSPPKTVFGGIKSVREGVGTKMTRIEEPPLSERRRRTTGAASDGDNEEVELRMRSQTTYVEARRVAKQIGASGYMECSALTLVNVVKVFDEAVRIAVDHRMTPSTRNYGRSKRDDDCIIV